MARLGDVIEQIRGVSYKPSDLSDKLDDNSVVLLRANNIKNGVLVFDDVVYVSKNKVNERQYLKKGDILVCTSSGSKELVGKAAFVRTDLPMVFGAFCKVIRPRVERAEYIGHFFQSPYYRNRISAASAGANINNLRNEHIADLQISLPPLDEQRKIVAMLDKVSDLIAKRRAQLDKLDLLVKARFVEIFGDPVSNSKGWKMGKAETHIDLLSGFPFDSAQYTENGINICGGLIIMPQRINWCDCKHWKSVEGYEEYTLEENDIVMALDRPWITEGFKIAMVDKEHLPALLIQRTARIRAVDINQRYLMYCFILGGFDRHCNVTGSLVPHISAKDIRSFLIMLPPLELQNQFSDFVAQTEKIRTSISRSLEKLETMKNALMQEYFG